MKTEEEEMFYKWLDRIYKREFEEAIEYLNSESPFKNTFKEEIKELKVGENKTCFTVDDGFCYIDSNGNPIHIKDEGN